MKSWQLIIGVAGILIAAYAEQPEKPAAAQTPMRFLFNAYDNDPQKVKPENISFQINTVDLGHRTEFLKLGEMIPKTPFKLTKFEYKTRFDPSLGVDADVSELTITDIKSGATFKLIYQKTIDASAVAPAK